MIRALRDDDPGVISAALTALGRDKPMSQYEKYLAEQRAGVRRVLVATQPSRRERRITHATHHRRSGHSRLLQRWALGADHFLVDEFLDRELMHDGWIGDTQPLPWIAPKQALAGPRGF